MSELESQAEGSSVGNDSLPSDPAGDLVLDAEVLHQENVPQNSQESVSEESRSESQPREDSETINIRESTRRLDYTAGKSNTVAPTSDLTQPNAGGRLGSPLGQIRSAFGDAQGGLANPSSLPGQQSKVQLEQAEKLGLAQNRILDLEREIERLRRENEDLISTKSFAKQRLDELTDKLRASERQRVEQESQAKMEVNMLKDVVMEKNRELSRQKTKMDEMDGRLHNDLKKIRFRERELENQLEISRLEKVAIDRAKNGKILELERELDEKRSGLDEYQKRVKDLENQINGLQDQIARGVRTLRLALGNLEGMTSADVVPIKKAE